MLSEGWRYFELNKTNLTCHTFVITGFDLNFPPAFSKFTSFMSAIVNLDFLNLMPLGCITASDFHRTLLFMTLGPLILGMFNLLIYVYFKVIGAKSKANQALGWFLLMTFMILPSVSTKIFSTFACRGEA